MNKALIERIGVIFNDKLQAKPSWGRNEIANLYNNSVAEALLELIDREE
jgi:hypothetical protein